MVLASGDARRWFRRCRSRSTFSLSQKLMARASKYFKQKKCEAKMAQIKHGASQSCPDDGSDSDRPFLDPDDPDMNLLFSEGSPHSDECEVCREWDLCRVFRSCPFCRERWTNQLCIHLPRLQNLQNRNVQQFRLTFESTNTYTKSCNS